jgi:disulfide bond formation protein DsbB
MTLTAPAGNFQRNVAIFLAIAMAVVVGSALGFEHIGHYIPCKLCLGQRTPYYVGVPLMALAAVSASLRWPPILTRLLLLVGGLIMVYSLYLAIRHSGVEWGWWAGPTDCGVGAAPVDTGGKGLLDALDTYTPPACDRAALRVLGLSFAGWNALASAFLAVVALVGAFSRR